MIPFGTDEGVKIDDAHAALISGLVKSNKPKKILEIGIGGGKSADAILDALEFNQQEFEYTLVDNWFDWQGQRPAAVDEKYGSKMTIIDSNEKDFVFSTKEKFDFIMSDGDHMATDQWFEYVYAELLNEGGILIYHDVDFVDPNAFKNLQNIYYKAKEYNIPHHLFNANSLPNERCYRGLMVVFKPTTAYDKN
jgi:predicted O-methyltransferase YrrM